MIEIEKQVVERVHSFDTFKAIAAIAVVFIHFGGFPIIDTGVKLLARFAVPYFFMISGYFTHGSNKEHIKKSVLKLTRLFLLSALIYLIYNIISSGVDSIFKEITLFNAVKVFVFNSPQITAPHLWYLITIIYCYILYYIFGKVKEKYLFFYICVALMIHLFAAEFLPIVFNVSFVFTAPPIVRNVWIFGFPFFLLGFLAKSKEKTLNNLLFSEVYAMFFTGVTLVLIEGLAIQTGKLHDLYIGNIIMVIAIFSFCLKKKDFGKQGIIEKIGKKYSLWIYILHPLVGGIICRNLILKGYIFKWLMPIFILFVTLIVSILIVFISNKIKLLKRKVFS